MPSPLPPVDRIKVVHFVTGGFSGATQVAVDLCLSALQGERFWPILILRRKAHTPMDRVQALRAAGLEVHVVDSHWFRGQTVRQLAALLKQLQPAALLAHGYPEHLIGREAGVSAGVPVLMQVEHNSRERYTPWTRRWSLRLAQHSAALVGVSEGVRGVLLAQGLPADKTHAIPNGVDLTRFADALPDGVREAGVVMSARFARQKDQACLVAALAVLAEQHGLRPKVYLAGTGPRLKQIQAQVVRLGLQGQVTFLGHHADMPGLLKSQCIYVLATHFEGMPLALVEAMASGCACIASDVVGVRGVLEDGVTGLLVPEGQPEALAEALRVLLCDPTQAARLGAAARARALQAHGLPLMRERYEALISRFATTEAPAAIARA
ncbi:glycosyltransferase [Roseateles sp. BYS87W]|uniref:Glycosyltransferase n=1 Tax=Pelomonas baiyunensis TaxID=3299026 RepID=A0ABW7GY81_9BURK